MTDQASVQAKYAAEAQRRMRPDGVAQYEELSHSDSERLRHLVDDIWADHVALDAQPSPMSPDECPKFLIVGAGIGGIVTAVRLIQQGFSADQMRMVETAGGVGGTWYWNRYPGLHCDVESYVYMPLLEEMDFMPSHKYAPGVEIRHHLESVVKKYQLDDKILLRTQVNRLEWDDTAHVWKASLTTGRGPRGQDMTTSTVKAEFVALTAGLLTKPQVPKLGGVGLTGFKGDIFHTSIWNFDVTGGSSEEVFPDMSKLKDKRVGIIGTGATAIQVVPCLAQYVKELYVFQRTPSAVYSRGQKATDKEEWANIAGEPGWQIARMENMAAHIERSAPPGTPNLVDDEWSKQRAYSALVGDPDSAFAPPEKVPELIARYQALDAENAERVRKRVSDIVKDETKAEKLTPWYPVWCKRPTFSDTYLQTFNEPHVHLVDTDAKGVESATPEALVVGGKEYPLDVLVLGTGYQSPSLGGGEPSIRAGVKVFGKGGRDLAEKWKTQGAATLHGCATNGFPNLFWLGPSQGAVSANQSHALEVQCRHIAYIVKAAHDRSGGVTKSGVTVEVEGSAEEDWSLRIMQGAARFAVMMVCTPSYMNNEGHAMDPKATQADLMKSARRSPWSGGLISFVREMERWRDEGDLSGIQVSVT